MNDPYRRAGLEEVLQLLGDELDSRTFLAAGETMKDVSMMDDLHSLYNLPEPDLGWDSVPSVDSSAQTPNEFLASSNADSWTDSDNSYFQNDFDSLPNPSQALSLNATTCLGLTDSFPSPLMSDSTYPSLDTSTRQEMIKIYFENVHPLCPIIDEQNFWWHHSVLSEEQFFGMFLAIMFNAMMFAAFAHAKDSQVKRAGFQSVCEVQAEYFRLLTEKYEYSRCEVWSEMEELVLAKTALLLSLWRPPKLDITINSLWADRAIYHSKQFLRKSSANTNMLPKRCDILYWCCISRNAFISYAMRRPFRLCIEEDQMLCDPEDLRSEFNREIMFHNFSSEEGKVKMVEDFVMLCKLGRTLNLILRSQRSVLFRMQLEGTTPKSVDTLDEEDGEGEVHDYLSRYLQAARFESELLELVEEHGKPNLNCMDNQVSEGASEDMVALTRSHCLSIITYSSIAALYQFTLSNTSRTWARSCHRTALSKVKDASEKVSSKVASLLANVSLEAIPGTILSWIVSPMITFLVEQNCEKFGFSTDDEEEEESFEMQKIQSLLKLTTALAPRFQSAGDVWHLLQNMDHLLCCDAAVREDSKSPQSSSSGSAGRRRYEDDEWSERHTVQVTLLVRAMQFIDREIGYDSPPPS